MRKRIASAVAFVALVCIFAAIYFYTPLKDGFDLDYIRSLVESLGMLAPIIYGIIYSIVILFFIPATPLTVLSGLLFGPFLGTIVVVIAATVSASVAFLIARFFGADAVSRFSGEQGIGKWIKKVELQCKNNGFVAFFILRNLFLPYILLSYASGLVKSAKLRDFASATFVSNTIHSFMFVYLGDSLLKGPKALIVPVILIILVLQIPKIVQRYEKKTK